MRKWFEKFIERKEGKKKVITCLIQLFDWTCVGRHCEGIREFERDGCFSKSSARSIVVFEEVGNVSFSVVVWHLVL